MRGEGCVWGPRSFRLGSSMHGARPCPWIQTPGWCFLACSFSTPRKRADGLDHSCVTTSALAHLSIFLPVKQPCILHLAFLPFTCLHVVPPELQGEGHNVATMSPQCCHSSRGVNTTVMTDKVAFYWLKSPLGSNSTVHTWSGDRGAEQGQPAPCWADTEGEGSCCGPLSLFSSSCSLGPTSQDLPTALPASLPGALTISNSATVEERCRKQCSAKNQLSHGDRLGMLQSTAGGCISLESDRRFPPSPAVHAIGVGRGLQSRL